MTPLSSIDDVVRLYAERGDLNYGENITQLEHALQCAVLIEEQGGPDSLIVAALLHDIGHLFEREAGVGSFDDRHEATGANALGTLFGEAVCKPIALHVAAKRYLCFKDVRYFDGLSPASKDSLRLQGGAFDAARAAAFERLPYWQDAVALRRADDTGKRTEPCGKSFDPFVPLLRKTAKAA
jgi:phosphonate degradation associated HDIG domain protein